MPCGPRSRQTDRLHFPADFAVISEDLGLMGVSDLAWVMMPRESEGFVANAVPCCGIVLIPIATVRMDAAPGPFYTAPSCFVCVLAP